MFLTPARGTAKAELPACITHNRKSLGDFSEAEGGLLEAYGVFWRSSKSHKTCLLTYVSLVLAQVPTRFGQLFALGTRPSRNLLPGHVGAFFRDFRGCS